MYWDITEVKPSGPRALHVRFADGVAGKVAFAESHLTGVFAALRDPELFAQVFAGHGAVAWPGDIDLAPDAMYQAIKLRGEWLLS